MASMSGTQHDSREQLSTDSIPPLPPPMPSLSQLVHQIRMSGHPKASFDEASNSIVEPPSFMPTHEDFDESSIYMTGVTSSTPVSEGGFYANFFPEVTICLLPSPTQFQQPPKPPATSAKLPATSAKPPAISAKPPPASDKPTTISAKTPAISAKPPAISAKPPPASDKPPTISAKTPVISVKPHSKKNKDAKRRMFMRRQNKLKECQDISPIDADGYPPKNSAREEQPWLP